MRTRSSDICKGDYIEIDHTPCVVKQRSACGRGKHGETFYKFIGEDLVSHESRTLLARHYVTKYTPVRELFLVTNVDVYVTITRADGSTADLPIPPGELGTTISDLFVTEPECKVRVTRVGNVEFITKVK